MNALIDHRCDQYREHLRTAYGSHEATVVYASLIDGRDHAWLDHNVQLYRNYLLVEERKRRKRAERHSMTVDMFE